MSVISSIRCAHNLRLPLLSVAVAAMTTACSIEPPPSIYTRDPADAAQPTPALAAPSVMGGYVSLRPAEPESWLDQNRRVTPPSKP